MNNIEKILSERLFAKDPPEKPQFASYLVRAMSALAIFTKGFKKCTPEAQEPFTRSLSLFVRALQLLPMNEEVRSKVLLFFHRMVECMQKDIFPYIPAALNQMLDPIPSSQSFVSVIRLINQLITRFRADLAELLASIMLDLTERLFKFIQSVEDPSEQRDLQRMYLVFLQTILLNNLSDLFFTERNLPHVSTFFTPVLQGCKGENIESTKVCDPPRTEPKKSNRRLVERQTVLCHFIPSRVKSEGPCQCRLSDDPPHH